MLFWQRKSTHKRFILWAKLAALSAALHIIVLAYFFFVFKDRSSRLSLVITPQMFNREVLFTIAPQPTQQPRAQAVAPVRKKQVIQKKPAKKTTIAKSVTPVAKKKVAPKKAQPTQSQPKPQVKKNTASVKPAASSGAKKSVPEKQKTIPVAQAEPKNPTQKSHELATTNHHELEVHQIGIHEKGLLEEFKALHEDIVSKWAPPPGIAPDCSCQVTMLIDWKGALREIKINESSGVLMYDTAAQKALTQIEMPKWTWGKEITITFNQ